MKTSVQVVLPPHNFTKTIELSFCGACFRLAVVLVVTNELLILFVHFVEKISFRKQQIGDQDRKSFSAIEEFCERFDKAVKNTLQQVSKSTHRRKRFVVQGVLLLLQYKCSLQEKISLSIQCWKKTLQVKTCYTCAKFTKLQ